MAMPRLIGVLGVLLVLVPGCGGGGSDGEGPGEPTAVVSITPDPVPTRTPAAPSPTGTASPFPEIVLATGRSFANGGERPLMLRNDGGGWEEVALGAPNLTVLDGVVFSAPDVAWAFGLRGDLENAVLLRSADAGRSWTDFTGHLAPRTPGIFDLAFEDASRGTLVARRTFGGPISVRTRDGGSTWPDGLTVPSAPMGGSYGVATRGSAVEVLVRDAAGLSVFRVDAPDLPSAVLTAESQPFVDEHNAIATVDERAWVATTVVESPASPSVAGIFASAAPGEPWVRRPVRPHLFAELTAIDVRDPANAIAGGRGTASSGRAAPMIFVIGADLTTWEIATTAKPPGASMNARVVDVVRLRDDAAWAITTDFDSNAVKYASAFLRSDDGGKTWSYVPTPFEDRVQLTDLARNTTTTH